MSVMDSEVTSAEGTRRSRSPDVAIVGTWLLLVMATLVVQWLAGQHSGDGSGRPGLDLSAIIVIGFVKILLVMFVFMNVKTAPWRLRFIVGAWALCACAGILLYVRNLR